MKKPELIERIKAFSEDRKNLLRNPNWEPLEPIFIITQSELADIIDTYTDFLEALTEISKGKGRYNMDKLTHASNTIDDMKELAINAIKKETE